VTIARSKTGLEGFGFATTMEERRRRGVVGRRRGEAVWEGAPGDKTKSVVPVWGGKDTT
jgi:hypothetical protein